MKEKTFRMLRKAAVPAMLALALTIPVGAFADRGGEHGGGNRGGEHSGYSRGGERGGSYRGGDRDDRYRGGDRDDRGRWGGGVYFGAPYSYGYAAPAPCGYYDQFGNWIATACTVGPYGY